MFEWETNCIACLYFDDDDDITLDDEFVSRFIKSKGAIAQSDTFTFTCVDGKGEMEQIEMRATEIKNQIDKAVSHFEIEKLQERLAKLTSGVAIVYVGGANEIEIKEQTNRRKRVAIDVAQSIEKEKEKPSSIPVFQEYNLMQIGDFILKQFPADAISVLDEFETLSPASQKEIVDFIILKYNCDPN